MKGIEVVRKRLRYDKIMYNQTKTNKIMAKYYDIHVFYSRSKGFSVPFKTNAEGEQEVIDAALKAGRIDAEDAESVDSVDEIYQEEYLLMGGNEEEDNESIEQN